MTAPRIVLVGPPGAGKSTIGRRLARALNTSLTDTDEMIQQRMGKPCGEVFASLGEPEFRRIEEEEVAKALTREGIVSLGGGAVISERTRDLLADHNVVYLEVSVKEGVRRTSGNDSRPVLAAEDPEAHYRALYESRRDFYESVASFKARSDERSPQRVVAEILSYLDDACDEGI
ncbi:shikimate kinase [Corynebacterium lactis]|uniref:Shikimate kinase n=1 Tax=Corynebacterium lactis RW2-5 TaxID=1408189 RepID=A0A0K2H0W3_9CORY|nr:shikimate kinase [Corynebacterium lactis]ALA67346.1 shikimate kinase [Corynebacterium lactis RW2-5]